MPKCHSCDCDLSQHSGGHCLHCGERRLERRFISDAFRKIVGCRPSMRKMDLCKLVRFTDDILQHMPRESRPSFRLVTSCVQRAFDDTMEEQRRRGLQGLQGVGPDFFNDFLCLVARALDLTVPSILLGLVERDEATQTLDELADESSRQPSRRRTIEVMETPVSQRSRSKSVVGACTKCGSRLISAAKFCCECGERQPEPVTWDGSGLHFFKGTERRLSAGGLQPEDELLQREFQELVMLAKTHHLPLEDVRRKRLEFNELDVNKDGTLSLAEFTAAVRRQCSIPEGTEVPTHLVDKAWFSANPGAASCVDFEAFLCWSCRVGCTEEILVADPHERDLRSLARAQGLPVTDVDRYYKVFARFQQEGGFIRAAEFRDIVSALLGCRKQADLPDQALQRLWAELDSQRAGRVSFERFLIWSVDNLDG